MGYDAHAFLFYGVEIERIDNEVAEELHTDNLRIVQTGSYATNNPALQDFIMVTDSYESIMSNNYEHIGCIRLNAVAQKLWSKFSSKDLLDEFWAFAKHNNLKIIGDFSWHVGAWGS